MSKEGRPQGCYSFPRCASCKKQNAGFVVVLVGVERAMCRSCRDAAAIRAADMKVEYREDVLVIYRPGQVPTLELTE